LAQKQFKIAQAEVDREYRRFHEHLEELLRRPVRRGKSPAMSLVFSDCAHVIFDRPKDAERFAVHALRSFILNDMPVRMGLSYGSFTNYEFKTGVLPNGHLIRHQALRVSTYNLFLSSTSTRIRAEGEVRMAGVSRRDFLQQAGGASAALAFMVANGITLNASPLGLPIGTQAWPHRARIGANSYAGLASLLKDMKAIGLDTIELVSPSGDFASLTDGKQVRRLSTITA